MAGEVARHQEEGEVVVEDLLNQGEVEVVEQGALVEQEEEVAVAEEVTNWTQNSI